MHHGRLEQTACRILGVVVWLVGVAIILTSAWTVRATVSRSRVRLHVTPLSPTGLSAGDLVYLESDHGLKRIGEVASASTQDVVLALDTEPFALLTADTTARCWQTPLSAEAAITTLLPPDIRRQVAARLVADWRRHDDALADAWQPLARELTTAYVEAVGDDIKASFEKRNEELWTIAGVHAQAVAEAWPAIQERLRPILQTHLTPVLSRLMDHALDDAPKMNIAWNVARGRYQVAFQRTLDFLTDYLGRLSDEDKAELEAALRRTWEEARQDDALMEQLAAIGKRIVSDEQLRDVLTDIYRESVAENPRTAEFLRDRVVQSPEVRRELYDFVGTFAPTLHRVLALCLFDHTGATRPEVVHLMRSTALRRQVAWVTLQRGEHDESLKPNATVKAIDWQVRR